MFLRFLNLLRDGYPLKSLSSINKKENILDKHQQFPLFFQTIIQKINKVGELLFNFSIHQSIFQFSQALIFIISHFRRQLIAQNQNIIVKSQIQMNFNQELYEEFVQRKRAKQMHPQEDASIVRRRSILRAFLQLPDQQDITLESSIGLLKKLAIIHSLQSVQDIVNIMQRKKRSTNGWTGSDQQILECRLIYFLWAIIEEESIEMREFKQLILVLASQQNNKAEAIRSIYGDKQGVSELIEAWNCLEKNAIQRAQSSTNNHSSISTQSHQSINDISIIKTKNEGNIESNKENISYFQDEDMSSSRKLKYSINKTNCPSTNTLEKSFQRRDSKTKLQGSRSSGKIVGRKSNSAALQSSGVKTSNFFTSNQNLSVQQERSLIARLYRCDQYKRREELKRQTQEQRVKAELNECSFKPNIRDRSRVMSRSKVGSEVKGYEKAIDRMKSGYKRNKELKQNLEYRIWTKPQGIQQSGQRLSAPKFLTRVKDPQVELFQILFTIGRHSIRLKIRESDKIGDIVANLGQIYSLKEDSKNYIRGIIEQELSRYYEAKCKEELKQEDTAQITQNS